MARRTPAERAAKGAAFLDEKVPGWFRRVKIRPLDLGDECRCVLGQLWEGDSSGVNPYMDQAKKLGISVNSTRGAVALGFDRSVKGGSVEYAALTEAWRDLIRVRRKGTPALAG